MKSKKISKSISFKGSSIEKREIEKSSLKDAKKSSFIEELSKADGRERRKHLEEILNLIDKQSKIFLEKPIYENLLKYKELIKSFMKKVLEKSYRVKEKISGRILEKQKIYYIVEKIDKNLEDLTQIVISNQSQTLDLIEKIDEIKGLLLDLYY